jgi:hypothetical protein
MTAASIYGPYTLQNAATATGTGTPFVIGGFATACLSVSGTFTALISVEVQGADSNWYAIDIIKSPGNYRYDVTAYNAIRANITSYTSGSVTVMGTAQALPSEGAIANTQGILLPSAARTATTSSAVQMNTNARGVIVTLNVTAASGTGGLTLRIQGVEPVTGNVYSINNAPTAVNATGLSAYVLYPGATASGSVAQVTGGVPLPKMWQVTVYVGDSSSYTYSVGYSLMI